MVSTIIDRIGNWNPQLFRELKGRLNKRNLAIAAGISGFGQLLLYLLFQKLLPTVYRHNTYNRYCTDSSHNNGQGVIRGYSCLKDALDNWIINWQLWWLDLFLIMSGIIFAALLFVGTYMLIADLSREERRGTLGFIRLSPQSTSSILIGKMLGVPILVYLIGLLAMPLHLAAGLGAHIPLSLILSFYGVLAASCMFFYSAALLYGLISSGLGRFQAWLGSGLVYFFLSLSGFSAQNHSASPADLLILFNPDYILEYLVGATSISVDRIGYFESENLAALKWFELPLWHYTYLGISLILLNYSLWTFWVWQGLKRRFYNRHATLLSKQQSYWFSTSLITIMLGFVEQTTKADRLFYNFGLLLVFDLILFLGLIAAMSPHRQSLQDWARYRHQTNPKERRGIVKDLIWGEKSPSTVAIAINLVITSIIMLPAIVLLPLDEYRIPVLLGVLFNISITLIYAILAQTMLLMKTPKRVIWASATVSVLIILPLAIFALFGIEPDVVPGVFLFSAFPMIATEYATATGIFLSLLAQGLAIALLSFQMNKKLQQAGKSATKALLN
ncbi:MAG: hypothetical protein F6K10_43915 [Moorea sp. SIO2B7]|nr:hypothetical protein [Moorena sp. SIO2B7]